MPYERLKFLKDLRKGKLCLEVMKRDDSCWAGPLAWDLKEGKEKVHTCEDTYFGLEEWKYGVCFIF